PKDFQPVVGRFENMQNVMHAKVAGITNEESRQKCKNEVAEKKPEYKQEHCANGNAHHRWHSKPLFVLWIFVVNPVEGVLKFCFGFRIAGQVKYVAMDQVFRQGKG